MKKIRLSLLEEAIIIKDQGIGEVLERTVKDAILVEKLGFERIWFAEHHNMANIASSSTPLLIGHIAEKTTHIRVGSGGVMLPNHSPLIVAEQFGTLDALYRDRIDLGVGRAPGADHATAMAIRRNNINSATYFKDDILSIRKYFENTDHSSKIRAFPGEGANVPMYILGSSIQSAKLAAELGLPYVFAAHFAPGMLYEASQIYREIFKPSAYASAPYLIICVNIIAADTKQEAYHLSSSLFNLLSGVITNEPHLLSPPTSQLIYSGLPQVELAVTQMTAATFVGDEEALSKEITSFIDFHQADEIMMTNYVFEHSLKQKSFMITRNALNHLL